MKAEKMQNAECKMQKEGLTAEEIAKSLRVCAGPERSCGECHMRSKRGCDKDARIAGAELIEAQDKRIGELEAELAKLREENRWIPVEEGLPENEVDVFILAERRLYGIPETDGKKRRIVAMAFHTDGKMNTEDSGYNWDLWGTDAEYDEEVDAYIIPEGWWESVRYGEEFSAVDDFVTHWRRPMPKRPEEAGQV